jgi:hypothetical protein
LVKGKLPEGFWIAADDAYENSNFCLTPYASTAAFTGMDAKDERTEMLKRDSYNFYQSSIRISIECAFGMLVKRWGIFWRTMTGTIAHNQLMILACMSLHNVIIDRGESDMSSRSDLMQIKRTPDGRSDAPCMWRDKRGYTQVEGRPVVYEQSECSTESVQGRRSDLCENKLRDELKNRLGAAGIMRPPHSGWGMQTVGKKRKNYNVRQAYE